MIKIPYDEILEKITSNSDLSKEEVEGKIKKKMDQLSGLISKEGAAHIIANEMNIKLFNQFSGRLQIKNILTGLRDVETLGKVTRKFELREFKVGEREGKVASAIIGDETGKIRIVMWGSLADKINDFKEGDIIKIKSAYSKENNGYRELHMNDKSTLEINPEGETIEEVKSNSKERKKISELKENENVEILGTIVDMFDPKFFPVCSECKRSAKEGNCKNHPEAEIKSSYVLNCFLDDGTDNIRCVFFRENAESLLSRNNEEMIKIKEKPESFAEIKKSMLGSIIKLGGRVVKNQMFERLEFMVNDVDAKPDPKEELARL